jgi:hypothetical protein
MRIAGNIFALVLITVLSALLDAKGFVYATRAWPAGVINLRSASLSILYFMGGVTLYILSIRIQHAIGPQSAVAQSTFWFAMTIIGVALMDGTLRNWTPSQITVGCSVCVGIAWLAVSTSHQ